MPPPTGCSRSAIPWCRRLEAGIARGCLRQESNTAPWPGNEGREARVLGITPRGPRHWPPPAGRAAPGQRRCARARHARPMLRAPGDPGAVTTGQPHRAPSRSVALADGLPGLAGPARHLAATRRCCCTLRRGARLPARERGERVAARRSRARRAPHRPRATKRVERGPVWATAGVRASVAGSRSSRPG